MEEKVIIASLAALAQPIRLKVFRALVVTGKAGMTPGTISDALDIPANTLSFHLKELAYSGLVSQERSSRNIIYRAEFDHVHELLAYLTENCCHGASCAVDTAMAARC